MVNHISFSAQWKVLISSMGKKMIGGLGSQWPSDVGQFSNRGPGQLHGMAKVLMRGSDDSVVLEESSSKRRR